MPKQHVEIKLTSVTTEVGPYTARTYQEGWSGKVSGTEDIRKQICEQVSELIRKFALHLENHLTAKVVLEDGTKLDVSIAVSLQGTYRPELTTQSIKAAKGEEVSIKFGSRLHNTLFRITQGRQLERTRGEVTLRALGLINNWGGSATTKGSEVLKQLDELGPPTNKRGLLMVARELFNVEYGISKVVHSYLIKHQFIILNQTASRFLLADKGGQWLRKYAHRIYNYKLPYKFDRAALVAYMSREQLAEALTSPVDDIRINAARRMEELGEELPPDIDTTPAAIDIDPATVKQLWKEIMKVE